MAKDILLYGGIESYSATEFIQEINEVLEKEPNADIVVRLNSPGGDVLYGWGAISKFSELKNKKIVKVDGQAKSMAFFFCCYAEVVEAVDVAEFVIHRAAYSSWVESNPEYFTEDRKASLKVTNDNLRKALEAKIDVAIFEKITKKTLDEIFSLDSRIDVELTAAQAKKIGLVQKINSLTLKEKSAIEATMYSIAAKHTGIRIAANTNQNKNKMTLAELKLENPALYAEVIEIGKKEGSTAELNRINAWLHFVGVDEKGVKEGIAGGKEITQVQILELTEKKFNAAALAKIEADAITAAAGGGSAAANPPGAPPANLTAEQKKAKELADWKKEVLASSNILEAIK